MMELNGTTKTHALARQGEERAESRRRLESIKMQRRRARRTKWSQGMKPLANKSAHGAETAN